VSDCSVDCCEYLLWHRVYMRGRARARVLCVRWDVLCPRSQFLSVACSGFGRAVCLSKSANFATFLFKLFDRRILQKPAEFASRCLTSAASATASGLRNGRGCRPLLTRACHLLSVASMQARKKDPSTTRTRGGEEGEVVLCVVSLQARAKRHQHKTHTRGGRTSPCDGAARSLPQSPHLGEVQLSVVQLSVA
jgi:hypothetical protein